MEIERDRLTVIVSEKQKRLCDGAIVRVALGREKERKGRSGPSQLGASRYDVCIGGRGVMKKRT